MQANAGVFHSWQAPSDESNSQSHGNPTYNTQASQQTFSRMHQMTNGAVPTPVYSSAENRILSCDTPLSHSVPYIAILTIHHGMAGEGRL